MGFPSQEYRNGLPCPPPGDLPDPAIEPGSPALKADSLLSEPPESPQEEQICPIYFPSLPWRPIPLFGERSENFHIKD